MNLSFISFHIILVISSPSSSTSGFLTLIFCPPPEEFLDCEPSNRPISDVNLAVGDMFGKLGGDERRRTVLVRQSRKGRRAFIGKVGTEKTAEWRDKHFLEPLPDVGLYSFHPTCAALNYGTWRRHTLHAVPCVSVCLGPTFAKNSAQGRASNCESRGQG